MRRQAVAVLAMAPLLFLGPTACMFGGKDGGGKPTAERAGDDAAQMRKFAQCMRDNGVAMEDPQVDGKGRVALKMGGSGGKGPDKQTMDKAQAKCRGLMPNGGRPAKPKPEDLVKLRAMAKCMREHGITDFPDPDADGGIKIQNSPGSASAIDPDSQAFQDAQKICDKLGPDRAKGGFGSGKSSSGGGAGLSGGGG